MSHRRLRVLDLFSGIGGFSLGLERTGGFQTVAFCEIDPFCREVLAKHWPGIPCHDDVTTLIPPPTDIIVGGFPCQDVSRAGKRAGLAGTRSGLYRELVRAIRLVRPKYAIVENVAALLGDGMGTVLGDLAESGADAEWDCVPAAAVGAPHLRDRIWIVAHPHGFDGRAGAGWEDRAEVGDGVVQGKASHAADSDGQRGQQSAVSGKEIGVWVGDGVEGRTSSNASDAAWIGCEGAESAGEAPGGGRRSSNAASSDSTSNATGLGCGQGWSRRPPDSFARVRDEARRNAADPYGARLSFRAGLDRDAWEKLTSAERDAVGDGGKSLWPDEPALSGVDDGIPDWMDRIKATGNTILPQIPELIGRAILAAEGLA